MSEPTKPEEPRDAPPSLYRSFTAVPAMVAQELNHWATKGYIPIAPPLPIKTVASQSGNGETMVVLLYVLLKKVS